MSKTILIGIAGLIGTLLRYWLAVFVARQSGETFPWGTLVVNIVGCLIAGAVFHLTEDRVRDSCHKEAQGQLVPLTGTLRLVVRTRRSRDCLRRHFLCRTCRLFRLEC